MLHNVTSQNNMYLVYSQAGKVMDQIKLNISHKQVIIQGLRIHNFTWNWFPINDLLINSLLTAIVESIYLTSLNYTSGSTVFDHLNIIGIYQ